LSTSRIVTSNQQGLHDKLEAVVSRHLNSPFKRPYPAHSREAFDQAQAWLATQGDKPLILDSYCGVGESTAAIAAANPGAAVIGLDKSLHRLDKHSDNYAHREQANYLLLRADVDDFWRLALEAGWQPVQHYLLYPNPWPKASQLKRRCHGSPLFPTLLALGGRIELRSNWRTYVEEFAAALTLAGHPCQAEPYQPNQVITPFERKYLGSGQSLWRCVGQLN
jgi:tRNA G46 methylase TrmB